MSLALIKCQVLGLEAQVLGLEDQVLGLEDQVLGLEAQVLGLEPQVLVDITGCYLSILTDSSASANIFQCLSYDLIEFHHDFNESLRTSAAMTLLSISLSRLCVWL